MITEQPKAYYYYTKRLPEGRVPARENTDLCVVAMSERDASLTVEELILANAPKPILVCVEEPIPAMSRKLWVTTSREAMAFQTGTRDLPGAFWKYEANSQPDEPNGKARFFKYASVY